MASDRLTWVSTGARTPPDARRSSPTTSPSSTAAEASGHVARREGGQRVRRGGGRPPGAGNGRVGGATEEKLFGDWAHCRDQDQQRSRALVGMVEDRADLLLQEGIWQTTSPPSTNTPASPRPRSTGSAWQRSDRGGAARRRTRPRSRPGPAPGSRDRTLCCPPRSGTRCPPRSRRRRPAALFRRANAGVPGLDARRLATSTRSPSGEGARSTSWRQGEPPIPMRKEGSACQTDGIVAARRGVHGQQGG
jgi:hypothetical protein